MTLDLTELLGLPEAVAGDLGTELGLGRRIPGTADIVFRQRYAIRIVTQIVLAPEVPPGWQCGPGTGRR